ncbi:hypothetical protein [Sphingomonas sp.]|uniref:hypothetical protein n=1 Tax=Sphingomonas sp. TaxID=28214 RepID=UPI00286C52FC|nr:hypothetical protein [Sphingomonas sp.]
MKIVNRVALAACVALGALTPASANHSWGSYHWGRTANPLTLKINEALTPNWEPYLQVAMDDWAVSTVLDFNPPSAAFSSASAKRCDPISGQVQVCNASYGQRGWLGIASIWANGDHITQGTTKLNDSYFTLAQYNTPAWRQFVTCQEIGHDFGLDHQDTDFSNPNLGTCMDYTNNPASNQHPNAHDFAQLVTMYTHLDSTNTATASAAATNFGVREVGKPAAQPGGDRGVGDTMADWGQAIGRDGKGRPDTFVHQLSDGRKVITHVLWALDAKGTEAK